MEKLELQNPIRVCSKQNTKNTQFQEAIFVKSLLTLALYSFILQINLSKAYNQKRNCVRYLKEI